MFHGIARLADLPGGPRYIGSGGARGPGKSHSAMAQAAIDDCYRVPDLKALFLRKVGIAARESFEDLRLKVLHRVAHDYVRAPMYTIRFPNSSRIVVGNFRQESDIEKYIGIEYDLIIIEEATQISLNTFTKIDGSLRTSKTNWRPRMYLTTNPGNIGHAWFKEMFVTPMRKGIEATTRFIPSTYKDNAFIDPGYRQYLEGLTGILGRMWRDGDWDVGAGMFFVNWDYDTHVVEPFPIPHHWPVWCSLDYGFSHPTAVYWHTANEDHIYTIAEHVAARWLVPQHAAVIHERSHKVATKRAHELTAFVAGHDVFAQKGDREATTVAQQYQTEKITLTRANIERLDGAAEILRRLGNKKANVPATWSIFNTCPQLIECIPRLMSDPKRPEDVLKIDADEAGLHGDDPYDACRYGIMVKYRKPQRQRRAQSVSHRTG